VMLMQVGGEGSRPTFFEMSAAQNLPSSLRSALLYSLGVMAQRRPILHRVLDHSDEAYSLLMLLLELHSLRTAGMLASYLFHCLHECLVLAELACCDEPWILLVPLELALCHKPQICGWFQMHHLQTPLFFLAKLAHVINPEFCRFLRTGII
jgi:hypothetical protein